jgi:hypothetical protein
MALVQVAQLARQAASDAGVLNALRDDPASVRGPLNLSDAQLRALISAGSFTTARPVVTTSHTEASQPNAIATLEVGTLFPPEGEGQFPAPGELPGSVGVAPHAPHATPTASPTSSQPPHPVPSRSPIAAHSPDAGAPSSTQAPGAGRTPARGQVPQSVPRAAPHIAPQAQGATPRAVPRAVTPQATAVISTGSGESNEEIVATDWDDQGSSGILPEPCTCDCGVCETAIVSIVAEVTAAAQTAITSITAIAGLH